MSTAMPGGSSPLGQPPHDLPPIHLSLHHWATSKEFIATSLVSGHDVLLYRNDTAGTAVDVGVVIAIEWYCYYSKLHNAELDRLGHQVPAERESVPASFDDPDAVNLLVQALMSGQLVRIGSGKAAPVVIPPRLYRHYRRLYQRKARDEIERTKGLKPGNGVTLKEMKRRLRREQKPPKDDSSS